MELDFFCAGWGTACAIANTSYCTSFHALDQVQKSIQKFDKNNSSLYKVDWQFGEFVQLSGSVPDPSVMAEVNTADWLHPNAWSPVN